MTIADQIKATYKSSKLQRLEGHVQDVHFGKQLARALRYFVTLTETHDGAARARAQNCASALTQIIDAKLEEECEISLKITIDRNLRVFYQAACGLAEAFGGVRPIEPTVRQIKAGRFAVEIPGSKATGDLDQEVVFALHRNRKIWVSQVDEGIFRKRANSKKAAIEGVALVVNGQALARRKWLSA